MKILINTNYNSAGTKVCVDDLMVKFKNAGFEITRNDWDNYQKYDLILFMAPDSQVEKAKKANPSAIIGIMIPTITKERIKEIKAADFLLVGSIEHRDCLLQYNNNIFVYYMFPEIKSLKKEHKSKDKIIIGYHGNKTHLSCMLDAVKAIDELSDKYKIELWAIYNIEKSGKWKRNLPQRCKTRHIQWSEENYYKYLAQCDIGIMPAKIPVNFFLGNSATRLLSSFLDNWPKYNNYDYLMRFKGGTNAGRVYVFSQFHIPVVADFMPSYCEIIQDGKSGYLVYSKQGWYWALEKLIVSPDLRNKMSNNLKNFINSNCSPEINFNNFLKFIEKIKL